MDRHAAQVRGVGVPALLHTYDLFSAYAFVIRDIPHLLVLHGKMRLLELIDLALDKFHLVQLSRHCVKPHVSIVFDLM